VRTIATEDVQNTYQQCENCKKITGGRLANLGRGAAGAEGVGCVPLPNRSGAWGGGIFLTFWLKIVHFGIYSDKNSQFSIE